MNYRVAYTAAGRCECRFIEATGKVAAMIAVEKSVEGAHATSVTEVASHITTNAQWAKEYAQ